MKKRIIPFMAVLVIVASVFVLPMSALGEEGFPSSNMGTDLDNIDLNYQSYRFWYKDPLPEQEQKVQQFIDDNCVISFSRNALNDILMGEAEVGTLRRALQSSKVFLTFSTPNDNPSTPNKYSLFCVATCPELDVYWYDGADDPHWELEASGTTLNMGGTSYDVITRFEIRQSYGSPVYQVDIGHTRIYPNGGNFYSDDFECTDVNIYLCKTTSIQDMSFNRFFNNIGGWRLDFPNQDSNAWQEGFDFGYQSGETAGIEIGKEEGTTIGREEGIEIGKEQGIVIGREEGEEIGFKDGYAEAVKTLDTSGAWANFKDLIFAIFDAPFYVISQALSFEVFGINIASTIIGLISTALIVWILKIIIVKLF